MRDVDDYYHIPLGQRREAACSCMFGGKGGRGVRMGRQMGVQSFVEDMNLQLMVNRQLVWWRGGSQRLENALTKSTGGGMGQAHLRTASQTALVGVGEQSWWERSWGPDAGSPRVPG